MSQPKLCVSSGKYTIFPDRKIHHCGWQWRTHAFSQQIHNQIVTKFLVPAPPFQTWGRHTLAINCLTTNKLQNPSCPPHPSRYGSGTPWLPTA
jgi:hypothetical protein